MPSPPAFPHYINRKITSKRDKRRQIFVNVKRQSIAPFAHEVVNSDNQEAVTYVIFVHVKKAAYFSAVSYFHFKI